MNNVIKAWGGRVVRLVRSTLYYQKADEKFFVCEFSKNVRSKLYHIENSNDLQTLRPQTISAPRHFGPKPSRPQSLRPQSPRPQSSRPHRHFGPWSSRPLRHFGPNYIFVFLYVFMYNIIRGASFRNMPVYYTAVLLSFDVYT